MSVRDDIAEVKLLLEEAEEAHRSAGRKLRSLHNFLAAKMVEHKDLLGLDEETIVVMGGGTPKTPDPDEE